MCLDGTCQTDDIGNDLLLLSCQKSRSRTPNLQEDIVFRIIPESNSVAIFCAIKMYKFHTVRAIYKPICLIT